MPVADPVQRRDHLARKGAGLLEHGLGQVEGQVAVKPLRKGAVEPADMAHGEDHLGHGRAIGHEFLPERHR